MCANLDFCYYFPTNTVHVVVAAFTDCHCKSWGGGVVRPKRSGGPCQGTMALRGSCQGTMGLGGPCRRTMGLEGPYRRTMEGGGPLACGSEVGNLRGLPLQVQEYMAITPKGSWPRTSWVGPGSLERCRMLVIVTPDMTIVHLILISSHRF